MTHHAFTYADFEATRQELVSTLRSALTPQDRRFLLSFVGGDPVWSLFPHTALPSQPAVQWKLLNLRRLRDRNSAKHAEQLQLLDVALNS